MNAKENTLLFHIKHRASLYVKFLLFINQETIQANSTLQVPAKITSMNDVNISFLNEN